MNENLKVVYIVTVYNSIFGVFANQEDAVQAQVENINKNRPADILCRSVVYPLKKTK